MNQAETQDIINMIEPKSAAEVISEKNSIINDLQNEVALLKKGIEDMHVKTASETAKYESIRKTHNILVDVNEKFKTRLEFAMDMHDTLINKLIGKI